MISRRRWNWQLAHGFLFWVIVAAVGGAAMSGLRDWVSVRLSSRFDNELSALLMSRLLRIPLFELKSRTPGEWLVASQYVQELKSALGLLGSQAFFDLILVVGYCGLLFYYDPLASGLYVLLSLFTLFALSRVGTTMYNAVNEAYTQKAAAQTYVNEALRSPLLSVLILAGWIQKRWTKSYGVPSNCFKKRMCSVLS